MLQCFIGFGGNLGDVAATFRRAAELLGRTPGVASVRLSRLYRTLAVGDQAGAAFLNAAAVLHASLPPLALLDLLQDVESRLGRTREVHWRPRTLDLDLLLYGDEIIDHPRLRAPHPGCWHRRFVLDPLVELAGDVVHPEKGATFGELRMRLLERPLPVTVAGGEDSLRRGIIAELRTRFADVVWSEWPGPNDGESNDATRFSTQAAQSCSLGAGPALILWLGPPVDFGALPVVPRLDVRRFPEEPATAVRYVLDAALASPVLVSGRDVCEGAAKSQATNVPR